MVDKAVRLSVKQFIDRFWPTPPAGDLPPIPSQNPFANVASLVAKKAVEKDVGDAFTKAVNAYTLTPGMQLRVCASRTDKGTSPLRVDGAFYRIGNPHAPVPEDGTPHTADQIVIVEFKRGDTSSDAFSDYGEPCPEAVDRTDARGQLATYAGKAFSFQHRLALFLLFVNGTECRLTRWDRSGVVITVVLDYCKEWKTFCEILWRMSQCSDEQLGLDPTARRIYPGDPLYQVMDEEMKNHASDIDLDNVTPSDLEKLASGQSVVYTYARKMFRTSLPDDAPRYVLDVPDAKGTRQYLVGRPIFITREVIGRGTLGFAALDRKTRQLAWLKDCWRADYPGVEPEGQILKELNGAEVPHIPTVVCYGDLPGQKTVSPEIWDWAKTLVDKDPSVALAAVRERQDDKSTTQRSSGPKTKRRQKQGRQQPKSKLPPPLQLEQPNATGTMSTLPKPSTPSKTPLRKHQHARLVVKEIALPLKDFKSGKTLLGVILDCLAAHYVAVNKETSRLHRDISDSNIMIVPKLEKVKDVKRIVKRGLLCDWEMSKRINADVKEPRQPVRSGTWQFKSATLLNNLDKAVDISDELESFFHVIVHYAVRYLESNLDTMGVADFIDDYFDTFRYIRATWSCGYHKESVLRSGTLRTSDSKTLVEFGEPLDNVLRTSLRWFHGNYAVQEYRTDLEKRQHAAPISPTPASSAPTALLRPDNEIDDDEPPMERLVEVQAINQNLKRPRADTTNSDNSTSVDHDDSRHAPPVVVPTQEQYQLAAKVKNHDEFLLLLDDALRSNQNNRRDPAGDRYPKDRKHHGGDNGIRLDRENAPHSYLGITVGMKRKPLKRARTGKAKTRFDEDEYQENVKTRNKDKNKNSAMSEDGGKDDSDEDEDGDREHSGDDGDDGDDGNDGGENDGHENDGDEEDGDEQDEESDDEDSKDEDYEDEDYEDEA
ncbi:hypothetical protein C8Q73DRAFT_688732 [Cubamyces lactineus]|nr:hypothetical protein C8Q73DRAFT_688732 [Cubamyces lactineus]